MDPRVIKLERVKIPKKIFWGVRNKLNGQEKGGKISTKITIFFTSEDLMDDTFQKGFPKVRGNVILRQQNQ